MDLDHDVLIVGSGLMGAAVARCLRDDDLGLRIGMIDGAPVLGTEPGRHLHDVADPEVWGRYNEKVSTGIQGFYTGVAPTVDTRGSMVGAEPGMYHLQSLGEDASQMPAAAVAWNIGGMGVHWTAATPTPWGVEINPHVPVDEWPIDLARAAELLRVNAAPFPATAAGQAVVDALRPLFDPISAEGRSIQLMPMAVNTTPSGAKERTGPSTIFGPIGADRADPCFRLFPGRLATAVLHEDGRATGVVATDVTDGSQHTITADHIVVCADAIRTPQLLFASGIRPPALGRYLNEHGFLTGQVLADPTRLGFDLASMDPPTDQEWAADCLWVPHSGPDQPFQLHIMNKVMIDDDLRPVAYAVGVEVYVPTQVNSDNALEFSESEVDAAGLPKITVRFAYSKADEATVVEARRVQQAAAELLGDFDPATESELLPAGSSLHFTGSVRMGGVDDGTSVCDTDCRVWGFSNLYVAGNGVVPTALTCNSTLTGMTTAVRAARAVSAAAAPPPA